MACLAVLSALAIFVPARFQTWAGTHEWTLMHRILEWGILVFSLVFVLISGLQELWATFIIWQRIRHLPVDQKPIVAYYVKNQVSAHVWVISDVGVRSLLEERILTLLPRPTVNPINDPKLDGFLYCRLRPWVQRYLTKRADLLK
jgi:hypothetical protein